MTTATITDTILGLPARGCSLEEIPFRSPESYGGHLGLATRTSCAIRYNTIAVLLLGDDEAVERFKADLLACFEDATDAKAWVRQLVRTHNGPAYSDLQYDWPYTVEDRFAW